MPPDVGLKPVVTYLLDEQTRLVAAGGVWDRFAVENGAPELCLPEPLGRPMDSFIADSTTAQLYRDIYAKVRRTGRPLSFPIRCDSPKIVRELNMTISASSGGFLVRSVVVREDNRVAMAFPTSQRGHADAFVHSCAWCKRIESRGKWLELELAVLTLSLFRQARPPAISHGICHDCLARMEILLSA